MRKLLRSLTATLGLMLALAAPLTLATVPAYATTSKEAACAGIGLAGSGDCGAAAAENKVSDVIGAVVNVLSLVVGAAAVIMIIVAGAKYITSGGDAGKVSSAKTALVYAIIGLVIVALAQFIVNFVLKQV